MRLRDAALLIVCLVLAACASASAGSPRPHTLVDAAPITDKVLVIIIENHALAQVKTDAPFTYALGTTYGLGTNMVAITHPSKPNYAAIAAGSTMGLTSDSSKRVKGQSVFGATIKAGRSAKAMMEGMGTDRCRHTSSSAKAGYVEKHDAPEFFSDESATCERYVFSYDKYGASDIAAGKLGNVELLVPNQCNNAHNCSLKTFDAWMRKTWARIVAGPDWKSGRLTVVITADEDDKKHGNVIPLIVAHPSLSHKVVTSKLTLYSLHRLLAQFGHTPPMAGGKTAPDMAAAFGLQVQ